MAFFVQAEVQEAYDRSKSGTTQRQISRRKQHFRSADSFWQAELSMSQNHYTPRAQPWLLFLDSRFQHLITSEVHLCEVDRASNFFFETRSSCMTLDELYGRTRAVSSSLDWQGCCWGPHGMSRFFSTDSLWTQFLGGRVPLFSDIFSVSLVFRYVGHCVPPCGRKLYCSIWDTQFLIHKLVIWCDLMRNILYAWVF